MVRSMLVCVIALVGCHPASLTQSRVTQDDGTTRMVHIIDAEPFDIDQHLGQRIVVEGVLEGNWMLSQTGEGFGITHKGRDPMRIRFHSVPLALGGESDELVKQMVNEAGSHVRLTGTISGIQVNGQGGVHMGQQGYTGPIPAHVVYYMEVSFCEVLSPPAATDGKSPVR